MQDYEEHIGQNIREVRLKKELSQQAVADKCGFANTVLSAYENNKKIPSLTTIAVIAKALDVSIERLYYGDDNNAFINSVSDEGRKIVNSVYLLWELGVISYFENYNHEMYEYSDHVKPIGMYLYIRKYSTQIKRFINSLDEFERIKTTYQEPDKYLEMLKSSIANEINIEIMQKARKSY